MAFAASAPDARSQEFSAKATECVTLECACRLRNRIRSILRLDAQDPEIGGHPAAQLQSPTISAKAFGENSRRISSTIKRICG